MNSNFKAIIFDFDYTLADSSLGVIDCVNTGLLRMGLPLQSDEAIRQTIGLSLPDTFLKLTGIDDLGPADEFSRLFIQRADEIMVDKTRLFRHVPDTIRELKNRGYRLGIVSTKYRRRIATILQRDRLLEPFTVIVGGEDVEHHKPHPAGLLQAMQQLALTRKELLYVGDSPVDAQTAAGAGIPFIAVRSGKSSAASFEHLALLATLDDVSALPHFLNQLAKQNH